MKKPASFNPVPWIPVLFLFLISCKDLPEASFTHSADIYEPGNLIQFTSTSINAKTHDWDFGDSESSTETNPAHTYLEAGTFTVKLTVTNDDGSAMASQQLSISAKKGKMITISVHSPGLEGNLLGDSPDRDVSIYLPPDYADSINKRYPVLYFLHGFTQDHTFWFGEITMHMNDLIITGVIEPMIVVGPNSKNAFWGSWYTNSIVTGDWEDFIVEDVVGYMDDNYRTIPQSSSRGIMGHSMGGYGTIKLAMRHPGIFSAAYALSPAYLSFEMVVTGTIKSFVVESVKAHAAGDLSGLSWESFTSVAGAAAWAPDPDAPPTYGQYPITEDGVTIDSVFSKWLMHDPCSMVPLYVDSLHKLAALKFCCGTNDEYLYSANNRFQKILEDNNIDYSYETYEGDHTSHISQRIRTKALPFFQEHLKK